MIRLAHVTDLHLGEAPPALVAEFAADLIAEAPDALLVGGDLTRAARGVEFIAAWRLLESVAPGIPVLAVPGNHDIPHWDLVDRFFKPKADWQAALPERVVTTLDLPGLSVIGLDTVSRAHWHLDWSAGSVSSRRLRALEEALRTRANPRCVVLTHHPLRHPSWATRRQPVRNAALALDLLRREGVELILSGHLHRAALLADEGRPWQVITPSALSARGSGQMGWTMLECGETGLAIRRRDWRAGQERREALPA